MHDTGIRDLDTVNESRHVGVDDHRRRLSTYLSESGANRSTSTFADGTDREYRGGFAMYGKTYETELAESLGCTRTGEGALAVDDDHETSVDGVYAVGDVTHGDNQTAIAIADEARAGIALDKHLRRFPRSSDELEDLDEESVSAAPATTGRGCASSGKTTPIQDCGIRGRIDSYWRSPSARWLVHVESCSWTVRGR